MNEMGPSAGQPDNAAPLPSGTGDDARVIVVGLGASAGALEVFERFLAHMPPDSGMALVLVQHLDPHRPTLLPELLSRHTRMPVQPATHGLIIEPDHVYVIPPGALLTIEKGTLCLAEPSESRSLRNPIDTFFRSLAEDQAERAVAIVLTGTGSDGTAGIQAIKEQGGLTLAQCPGSARFDGMPASAVGTGLVDYVLPVEQMPAKLLEWAGPLKGGARGQSEDLHQQIAGHLDGLCAILLKATGHDFSRYKPGTLIRRIARRLHLRGVGSMTDYLATLERDAQEAGELFKDLLIGVTQFFRDPEAFELLAREVLPRLFEKAGDEPVRIWVPGCASGEEAYSMAMLAREYLARAGRDHPVQIFATDIDEEVLAVARQGRYPAGIAGQMSSERLERFFVPEPSGYRASQELRDLCVFSQHNLIKDPPFSGLGLISCRNLLIYLEVDLQKRLGPLFHYALQPGGYLLLGPSEGLADHPELFLTVDKQWRLFQRNDAAKAPAVEFPLADRGRRPAQAPGLLLRGGAARDPQQSVGRVFERLLLEQFTPPAVMVNGQGEILYFSGAANPYLRQPLGTTSNNLFDLAHGNLRVELRAAVNKAARTRQPVRREGISFQADGKRQSVDLLVRPMGEPGSDGGMLAVIFHGRKADKAAAAKKTDHPVPTDQVIIQHLEDELRVAREDLQVAVEELESTNEELKSSNEELLSTNEELQSANEELQTSKEELQSANEELETVNDELSRKVTELDAAHSDLQNLFTSTQIATVFLDHELRVKKFTPAATSLFNLLETDLGRLIEDFAPRFSGTDLLRDIRETMRTLRTTERQVRVADQQTWYMVRILPYRTINNLIAGVVVTFVDVTAVKEAERALTERARLLDLSSDAILVRDAQDRIAYWSHGAAQMYGWTAEEALGQSPHALLKTESPEALEQLLARLERDGRWEGELVHTARDGRRITVATRWALDRDSQGRRAGILETNTDITERKRAEAALRDTEQRFRTMADAIPQLAWMAQPDGYIFWYNRRWHEYTGTTPEQMEGWGWQSVHDPEMLPKVLERWKASIATGQLFDMEFPLRGADGRFRWFLTRVMPLKDAEGKVVRWFGTNTDVGAKREAEAALRESEERYRTLFTNMTEGFALGEAICGEDGVPRDFTFLEVNDAFEQQTGLPRDILGRPMTEVLPNLEKNWIETYGAVALTGRSVRFDSFNQDTGRHYDVFCYSPAQGRFAILFRDITEQKRAEEQARLWERVFAGAEFGLACANAADNTFIAVNPTFARQRGYTPEELVGTPLLAVYAPEVREQAKQTLDTIDRTGHLVYESVQQRKDGTCFPVLMEVTVIKDAEGRPVSRVAYALDITQRKQAEAALRQSEEQLRVATLAAEIGVWSWTPGTNHVIVSANWRRLFGIAPEAEVAFETWCNALHPEDRERAVRELNAASEQHREFNTEYRVLRADGTVRWIVDRGRASYDEQGRAIGMAGVNLDITERKQTEEQLRQAQEQLTQSNLNLEGLVLERTAKLHETIGELEHFSYSITHDMRAPLRAMQGFAQMILEGCAACSQPEPREFLRRLMAAADRMDRLITDALAYSRVVRTEYPLTPVDVKPLLRGMLETYPNLQRPNAEVVLEGDFPMVMGNEAALTQCFSNLLGNAVKFVAAGTVPRVRVWAEEVSNGKREARSDHPPSTPQPSTLSGPAGKWVRIWVEDNGIGIPRDSLDRIFGMFQRLDKKYEGTGIGLALVRKNAERMGGKVGVESEPGKGSRFWLALKRCG